MRSLLPSLCIHHQAPLLPWKLGRQGLMQTGRRSAEGPMGVPGHMPCLCMNGRILAFICNSDNLEFIELVLKNPETIGNSHIYLNILDS